MADGTKIEWTDATVNVVNGCTVCSPGCANCYAMRAGGRSLPGHPCTGLTKPSNAGHVWTGEARFNERALLQPLRWKRPRRIFWNAHGDLFHENVPDDWIDRCFAVMALTPQHQHQVLTKRSARMRAYFSAPMLRQQMRGDHVREINRSGRNPNKGCTPDAMLAPYPLTNVWLGVSVEDQTRADERIPDLLATPAAVRFLSCEPLLGPINLKRIRNAAELGGPLNALTGYQSLTPAGGAGVGYYFAQDDEPVPQINWVIVGGESGTGARPMHPDWARSLRDQCAAASVSFLFKQWGDWLPIGDRDKHGFNGFKFIDHLPQQEGMFRAGKRAAGRLLDGVQHDGMPS
jgi:protein gp37